MVNFLKFVLINILLISTASALETTAKQAILLDLSTKEVLFEKNSQEKMFPSSMSKLMTTYIVFKKLRAGDLDLSTKFKVSEKAWKTGGSRTFLDLDDEVSVEDLLRGVIVQSGNDAAVVLAEGISGDEEQFAKLMNDTAKELGLNNSNFTNSTGLPDENHVMTANDLVKLATAIIGEFPEYYEFFSQKEFTYNNITQPNRNTLIGELGVDGMKTGHTDAGGYGVVVSAKEGGRRLILVVNGLRNELERAKEVKEILDYGFKNFKVAKVLSKDQQIGEVKVWYGDRASLPIVVSEDVNIIEKQNGSLHSVLRYKEPLVAPIKKGDKVAEIQIENAGEQKIIEIVASEDMPESSAIKRLFQNVEILVRKNLNKYLSSK
jgi:D-alanyl-D-alanine carboxypeptidase (penicillin-binding protein 5/6)